MEGSTIDVPRFPAPKWHEDDGGRYIGTECIVITRDPDSDWVNLGTYRVDGARQEHSLRLHQHGKHGDFIRRKYGIAANLVR